MKNTAIRESAAGDRKPVGDFPYQVEIVVPIRPASRQMLMAWCLGKLYRTVPSSTQPGHPARWCFATADDADFFQATFGGRMIR